MLRITITISLFHICSAFGPFVITYFAWFFFSFFYFFVQFLLLFHFLFFFFFFGNSDWLYAAIFTHGWIGFWGFHVMWCIFLYVYVECRKAVVAMAQLMVMVAVIWLHLEKMLDIKRFLYNGMVRFRWFI